MNAGYDLLDQPLAKIVNDIPGATSVLHQYRLDFCCGGAQTLQQALSKKSIVPESVLQPLQALREREQVEQRWDQRSVDELIEHILERYHAVHRQQLPELHRLAQRVERVHADRPECPRGLAACLAQMSDDLEQHMLKEEAILFPLFLEAEFEQAQGPVCVMRHEHTDHGQTLEQLMELTQGYVPPQDACNTWRALYRGLEALHRDLMQHIHLENNILFQKVNV